MNHQLNTTGVITEARRALSTESEIAVPIQWALISGLLAGGVCLAITVALTAFLPLDPQPEQLLAIFLVPALIVTSLDWLYHRLRFLPKLLFRVETLTGLDLNQDRQIGFPAHPMAVNLPRQPSDAEQQKQAFTDFILHCYDHGTTHMGLRGAGFRDEDIVRFRDYAINILKLGQWRGKRANDGWQLTVNQEEALRVIESTLWIDRKK